ncbi:UDP-GalNAc:polypeptide N-acetylgalactosaminyl transferase, putative [Ixodes scapularis]|uniref:Polypeptide N-acetylgalactosaminyltransferase n=1 Tax=Ixodes scapularis TaxID=6945 RepID=B7PEU0_IXOSC|nr:UDP-GalNAc:polypeptide N-acetylgalactosaminyl transferase, putative [Ixodes scapularis]|eukprot:XP_002433712.1 UDP-GalNAc:polypeptide N-acetylgalactosaminyl transferase, putative [Ixodes scapularis]
MPALPSRTGRESEDAAGAGTSACPPLQLGGSADGGPEKAADGSVVVADASRLGVIRSPKDQQVKVAGYHQHAFNLLISNRLGFYRSLPDTRNPLYRPFLLGIGATLLVWCLLGGSVDGGPEKAADGSVVVADASRLGVIRSPKDQQVKVAGYHQHAFNLLISNRLGFYRSLPDTRNPLCRSEEHGAELPTASVVVCFYNEAWSTLLRTVHTVLGRTPRHLLHEVILVDDNSTQVDLGPQLAEYVSSQLPSHVRLIRTRDREGLIRARMFGARNASGEVLVFLDSHCEVNVGWLEPLLERIRANRATVTCPIIDIINADTFEYTASPIVRGGFNWGLHFKWESPPAGLARKGRGAIAPIPSPTMAGGLFAMDRKFFHRLGEYDDGMDIWGGENLEISFRIWMCGGQLEIIPCSRVGHVFRRRRPYGSPNGEDTLTKNSLRVAHVWMDDYKKYYFQTRSDVVGKPYGDITSRVALRKRLGCRSFDWYMKTVYPELQPPSKDGPKRSKKQRNKALHRNLKRKMPAILGRFQLQLFGSHLCIESEDDVTTKGSALLLGECATVKRQLWYETEKHDLRLANLLCLDGGDQFPTLAKCHEMGGSQDWRHSSNKAAPLYNLAAGLCLGSKRVAAGEPVTMEMCDDASASRHWTFKKVAAP